MGRFDDNDNTIGHIAALTGNSNLFKVNPLRTFQISSIIIDAYCITTQVVFPLTSLKIEPSASDEQAREENKGLVSLEEFAEQKIRRGQFAALMWENCDGKTPLHLAIENNHTSLVDLSNFVLS